VATANGLPSSAFSSAGVPAAPAGNGAVKKAVAKKSPAKKAPAKMVHA
jgi:hypothetical protein